MPHKLSYLGVPLDQCPKAQLIACIEGLNRNLTALRAERDKLEIYFHFYHSARAFPSGPDYNVRN